MMISHGFPMLPFGRPTSRLRCPLLCALCVCVCIGVNFKCRRTERDSCARHTQRARRRACYEWNVPLRPSLTVPCAFYVSSTTTLHTTATTRSFANFLQGAPLPDFRTHHFPANTVFQPRSRSRPFARFPLHTAVAHAAAAAAARLLRTIAK